MKKISEHLGQIVVALAGIALLITAISLFNAPIGSFFEDIIDTEKNVGNKILNTLDDVDMTLPTPGGSGGSGSGSSVTMLDGAGQTVNKQFLTESVRFRSSADLADFESVKVNGSIVDPSNYTLASGSTIVIFNADYVQNLAVNTHSIDIVSTTGTASTNFTVIDTAVIPEGGAYYVGAKVCDICGGYAFTGDCPDCGESYTPSTKYSAGDEFPSSIADGHAFVYGDYIYVYDPSTNGWTVRRLSVADYKTSYGEIISIINNIKVTSISGLFAHCEEMTSAPAIPSSVIDMTSAFEGCYSLTTAPMIPNSVKNMDSAFFESGITGDIEINANPSSYEYCLAGTKITNIVGSCSQEIKDAILADKDSWK